MSITPNPFFKITAIEKPYYKETDFNVVGQTRLYLDNSLDFPEYTIRRKVTVDTDVNSVYLSKSGNDSNPGTKASPKLTLSAAIFILSSPTKITVTILDDGEYILDPSTFLDFKIIIQSEFGFMPTIKFKDFREDVYMGGNNWPVVGGGYSNYYQLYFFALRNTATDDLYLYKFDGSTITPSGNNPYDGDYYFGLKVANYDKRPYLFGTNGIYRIIYRLDTSFTETQIYKYGAIANVLDFAIGKFGPRFPPYQNTIYFAFSYYDESTNTGSIEITSPAIYPPGTPSFEEVITTDLWGYLCETVTTLYVGCREGVYSLTYDLYNDPILLQEIASPKPTTFIGTYVDPANYDNELHDGDLRAVYAGTEGYIVAPNEYVITIYLLIEGDNSWKSFSIDLEHNVGQVTGIAYKKVPNHFDYLIITYLDGSDVDVVEKKIAIINIETEEVSIYEYTVLSQYDKFLDAENNASPVYYHDSTDQRYNYFRYLNFNSDVGRFYFFKWFNECKVPYPLILNNIKIDRNELGSAGFNWIYDSGESGEFRLEWCDVTRVNSIFYQSIDVETPSNKDVVCYNCYFNDLQHGFNGSTINASTDITYRGSVLNVELFNSIFVNLINTCVGMNSEDFIKYCDFLFVGVGVKYGDTIEKSIFQYCSIIAIDSVEPTLIKVFFSHNVADLNDEVDGYSVGDPLFKSLIEPYDFHVFSGNRCEPFTSPVIYGTQFILDFGSVAGTAPASKSVVIDVSSYKYKVGYVYVERISGSPIDNYSVDISESDSALGPWDSLYNTTESVDLEHNIPININKDYLKIEVTPSGGTSSYQYDYKVLARDYNAVAVKREYDTSYDNELEILINSPYEIKRDAGFQSITKQNLEGTELSIRKPSLRVALKFDWGKKATLVQPQQLYDLWYLHQIANALKIYIYTEEETGEATYGSTTIQSDEGIRPFLKTIGYQDDDVIEYLEVATARWQRNSLLSFYNSDDENEFKIIANTETRIYGSGINPSSTKFSISYFKGRLNKTSLELIKGYQDNLHQYISENVPWLGLELVFEESLSDYC